MTKKTKRTSPQAKATARLHMALTEEARKELDAMKNRAGCATITEVVQRALRVYKKLEELEEQRGVVLKMHAQDGTVTELLVVP